MNLHKEDLDGNLEYEFNQPLMIPSGISNFTDFLKDGANVIFKDVNKKLNFIDF